MDINKKIAKEVNSKFSELDLRVKTSFTLIRQDLSEMQKTIEAMRKYLKKKDKQYNSLKKEDDKIREEFRRDVDDFTQKISELKLALEEVRKLKREVVIKKDLAQIEERIKTSFRDDLEYYERRIRDFETNQDELLGRIAALENGTVIEKKKKGIFNRKK
jgi:exonuclease VII large subunit